MEVEQTEEKKEELPTTEEKSDVEGKEVEQQTEEEPKIESAETGEEVKLNLRAVLEERLEGLKFEEQSLQTLLLLGLYRQEVPEERKPEPEPVLTPEAEKEIELREELTNLKAQLRNDRIRIDGGFNKEVGRNVKAVDEEIKDIKKMVRKFELEIQLDVPVRPQYRYQDNSEYREILKYFKEYGSSGLNDHKKLLEAVEKQKTEIEERIPKNQARINEIQAELGLEKTNFINTK